jgi:hypothetical protein
MIEYYRDIPVDAPEEDKYRTVEHVRDFVAGMADGDDNPTTRREDVQVALELIEDGAVLRVKGYLDAEPDAPYLKEDFNPFEGVDPELLEQEILAAQRGRLEVLDGSQ